ncbi:MAG: type 4a pilus biogenesis protein PilO [Gammaproteobacteria bacterium]|nr:type 4a pilus biogenesis protein PilO [Gammaproteobacteria bacterium]
MDLAELNELDFSDVSAWPLPVRIVVVVLIISLVLGLGYWFDTKDQLVELQQQEQREGELKMIFESRSVLAANLDAYKKQLAEMRKSFGAMLRQLPDKTEVADLLVDVSQTGLVSGLEFELFRPMEELPKDFYAELPIRIKVLGGYHEFGEFVSGVAALPRIVTVHDIIIKPIGDSADGSLLSMEMIAKTYRYLDENELGNEE